VQARLVYDTKTQSLAPGVRAAVQRGRRIFYAVEATELVLQIILERRPDHVRLIGQVFDEGMPVEGATVDLRGGAGSCTTPPTRRASSVSTTSPLAAMAWTSQRAGTMSGSSSSTSPEADR